MNTKPVVGSMEQVPSLRRDSFVCDRYCYVISRDFDIKEAGRCIKESGYNHATDAQGIYYTNLYVLLKSKQK